MKICCEIKDIYRFVRILNIPIHPNVYECMMACISLFRLYYYMRKAMNI